jgi:DNA-binding FadR family transcriptional regulator
MIKTFKPFRKVKRNRIFQDIIDQIQEAIIHGKLKPGSKLPPERELKEAFQTSRGTIREALRGLEQKGLIIIKTGMSGGATVNPLTTQQVSESLNLLIRCQRISLRDLIEFREYAEGTVAQIAAKRARREDIQYLNYLLKESKAKLAEGVSGWNGFIKTNRELHVALVRIARNSIYESVLQTIHDNIDRYYSRLPRKESIMKEMYRDWYQILKAVEKREADTASSLIRGHISRYNRLIGKSIRPKEKSKKINWTVEKII